MPKHIYIYVWALKKGWNHRKKVLLFNCFFNDFIGNEDGILAVIDQFLWCIARWAN